MNNVRFLLVTCCLERSRAQLLEEVVSNLNDEAPWLGSALTVFDNASTEPNVIDLLRSSFSNVHRCSTNVGYWTAIDWWLRSLIDDQPRYTYIIESDMIHYGFDRMRSCISYLDRHVDVGSVRLHEYSVSERRRYDKDRPVSDSKRNLWQSHTNRITGLPIVIEPSEGDVWSTTFLTQLPALNRYGTMLEVFNELRELPAFTEHDFQRSYWRRYQRTGILDGGIFHCDLNPYGSKAITGSWTSERDLKRLGYHPTRTTSIISPDGYNVTPVG